MGPFKTQVIVPTIGSIQNPSYITYNWYIKNPSYSTYQWVYLKPKL